MTRIRRPALDGLRGVAVLCVVSYHVAPDTMLGAGGMGVLVFFVLSGYLITGLLLDESSRTGQIRLRDFYIRRAGRLLPALIATLAVVIAVASAVPVPNLPLHAVLLGCAYGLGYITNVVAALHPENVPLALTHLWSLATEEQFYLIWPLVLPFIVRPRKNLRLPVLLASLLIAFAGLRMVGVSWLINSSGNPYFLPTSWTESLLLGASAAMLVRSDSATAQVWVKHLTGRPAALTGTIVLAVSCVIPVFVVTLTLQNLAAIALLLTLEQRRNGPLAKALSSRTAVWLGGISYSLYLLHMPSIGFAEAYGGDTFVARACGAVVAIALAAACRRFIEVPGMRLRDRFSSDLSSREQAGPPPLPAARASGNIPA